MYIPATMECSPFGEAKGRPLVWDLLWKEFSARKRKFGTVQEMIFCTLSPLVVEPSEKVLILNQLAIHEVYSR
jgi:hypothetical protein